MSRADGSVIIDTRLNNKGFERGLKSLGKDMGGLKATVNSLKSTMAVAFTGAALASFAKQCIDLGSDVAEVQNVVDVSFGDMKYKVEEFAESSIEALGLSKLSAKRTASTYMSMARGMGIAAGTASDMALNMTAATADVASFYNISQELADTKLRSVFTGETETLKDLGIVMTQVNLQSYAMSKGITKSISQMSQNEQVMLRYSFVMDKLSLAQGDFARTQSSWANQVRILTEQWKELQSILGNVLTGILLPLVQVLNEMVGQLIFVTRAIQTFIFGVEQSENATKDVSTAIGGAVDNQDALTDAIKKTNKEQQKSLAGFDQIQKLSAGAAAAEDGVSAGVPGLGAGADFDIEPFKMAPLQQVSDLMEGIAKAVWLIVAGFALWKIADKLPGNLGVIAAQIGMLLIALGGLLVLWYGIADAFKNGVDWKNLFAMLTGTGILVYALWTLFGKTGAAIGLLIGGLGMLVTAFHDVSKNGFTLHNTLLLLAGLISTGLGISLLTGSMIPALIAGIVGILTAIVVLAGNGEQLIGNLKDVFGGLKDFIVGIFTGDVKKAFGGLGRFVKGIFNTVLTIFGSAVNLIIRGINWIIKKINGLSFDVPDWVPIIGGGKWGPSIPTVPEWKIPQLAAGAVIPPNNRFLAMLGDQRAGTNVEAPLSTIVEAMKIALGSSGAQQKAVMVLDEQVVGKLMYKMYNRQSRIMGVEIGGNT